MRVQPSRGPIVGPREGARRRATRRARPPEWWRVARVEARASLEVPRASLGVPRASLGVPRASLGMPGASLEVTREARGSTWASVGSTRDALGAPGRYSRCADGCSRRTDRCSRLGDRRRGNAESDNRRHERWRCGHIESGARHTEGVSRCGEGCSRHVETSLGIREGSCRHNESVSRHTESVFRYGEGCFRHTESVSRNAERPLSRHREHLSAYRGRPRSNLAMLSALLGGLSECRGMLSVGRERPGIRRAQVAGIVDARESRSASIDVRRGALGVAREALGRPRAAVGETRDALGKSRAPLGEAIEALGRARGALGETRGALGTARAAHRPPPSRRRRRPSSSRNGPRNSERKASASIFVPRSSIANPRAPSHGRHHHAGDRGLGRVLGSGSGTVGRRGPGGRGACRTGRSGRTGASSCGEQRGAGDGQHPALVAGSRGRGGRGGARLLLLTRAAWAPASPQTTRASGRAALLGFLVADGVGKRTENRGNAIGPTESSTSFLSRTTTSSERCARSAYLPRLSLPAHENPPRASRPGTPSRAQRSS